MTLKCVKKIEGTADENWLQNATCERLLIEEKKSLFIRLFKYVTHFLKYTKISNLEPFNPTGLRLMHTLNESRLFCDNYCACFVHAFLTQMVIKHFHIC